MASIEKRGINSYRLIVEAGYGVDKQRIKRYKTIKIEEKMTPKKQKEYLEEELLRFKIEVEAGEYIAPEKMTVESFMEEWRQKYAVVELAPKTWKEYIKLLKRYVLPTIGHKRLDQIKTLELVRLINQLGKPEARINGGGETLSSGTIHCIHRAMRNVFSRAVEWKLIKNNPMDGVKRPPRESKEMDFFSEDEVWQVIDALCMEEQSWRLLILAAMFGGLRRGEIVALEWSDIDFDNHTIRIDESISLTENGVAFIRKPKTKASIGNVDMPEWYISELKEYQQTWLSYKELVKDRWIGEKREFIFHNGFGKPLNNNYPSEWWRLFCKRHKIRKIRFHDLRHTAATILLENNVDMKIIQKRLRHAQYSTTAELYAHVTKKVSRAAAEKFDKFNPAAR